MFQWGRKNQRTQVKSLTSKLGTSKRGAWLWQFGSQNNNIHRLFQVFPSTTSKDAFLHPGFYMTILSGGIFRSLCDVVPSARATFIVIVVRWCGCLPRVKPHYCLLREPHSGAVPDNGRVHWEVPCFALLCIVQYVHLCRCTFESLGEL